MKRIQFSILASILLMIAACDEVDTANRLTFVEPPQVSRAVLIEDFTGQYCVNCPRATEEIERLVNEFGDTTVIAVAIHSGPFSKRQGEFTPLYTAQGDEYFTHWGLSAQPIGLVDRMFSAQPLDFFNWAEAVNMELEKEAPVSITVDVSREEDDEQYHVNVQLIGLDSTRLSGKLQVWLVEDSIDSFQLMPNGKRNDHYNHMHVFRTSVNGAWGDDVVLNHGDVIEKRYNLLMDAVWEPDNCSIVAFVYDNNEGVRQVTKKKINNTINNN